jgi:hypothetical protein
MQLWNQQQLWQQQQQQYCKQQQKGSLKQLLQQHVNSNNITCQVESTDVKTGDVVDNNGFNLKGRFQENEDNNSRETITIIETTSKTGGVVDNSGFNLKGRFQEKEDNNSRETITIIETTLKPTKNGVDISTQEITGTRGDNKTENDLKIQTRVENEITSVHVKTQTPGVTTLLTRQLKRNLDPGLVSKITYTPLVTPVPIPLVTTQTTQPAVGKEEMKINGSTTSSRAPPMKTLISLVPPTTPEMVPTTTLRIKHQNMNKRVDKKKRCRGEIVDSWVKSKIMITPRITNTRSTMTKIKARRNKTRKECQLKVPITPRQVKTCRVDQGRRVVTSRTSTTIWLSILGRSRPPEADPEPLLLDTQQV